MDEVTGRLGRRIALGLAAGFVVLLVLSLVADLGDVADALADFHLRYIPAILGLTLLNYLLRFAKWHYYLRILDIRPGLRDSTLVFASGLSMSITPAKLGEVLKAYLLHRLHGTDISRTVPIVLAERLTDIFGLLALATLSFSALRLGSAVLLAVVVALAGLLILVQSRAAVYWLLDRLERIPRCARLGNSVRQGYEAAYLLFRPVSLAVAIPLSIVSWGFECVALYYVLQGFGVPGSLALSSFAFSFSSLAGAVSMVPGGLGVAEGSMAGLLVLGHIPAAQAAGATAIIRLGTLWFGVALGVVALAFTTRRIARANTSDPGESSESGFQPGA